MTNSTSLYTQFQDKLTIKKNCDGVACEARSLLITLCIAILMLVLVHIKTTYTYIYHNDNTDDDFDLQQFDLYTSLLSYALFYLVMKNTNPLLIHLLEVMVSEGTF